MELKDGDKFSYATILVQSHGFMIRTNEKFSYEIEVDDLGLTLQIHAGPMNPNNVSCKVHEIDQMIWDERNRNGASHVMVYRAGKSEAEVMDLIHPQIQVHIQRLKIAYETLVKNAQHMLDATSTSCPTDYICPKEAP